MSDFSNSTLLVTGAGGHLGRLAVEELLARGAKRVVAGTRKPVALKSLGDRGIDVRHLDFDDAASLRAAFAGIDRALLISTVAPDRAVHQVKAVDAAKAAGIRHIVYTSGPNVRPNADAGGIADHFWTEHAIAASGVDFTLLRNHIYADTVIDSAASALASGKLFDATEGGGRNYVTRADAARTAAGALLTDAGKTIFDVTGPAPVTQQQLASLCMRLTGRPVTRIGLSSEQLLNSLQEAGLPFAMAQLLVAFDRDTAHGHHAIIANTVERFTGRSPETLESFLEANKAALLG